MSPNSDATVASVDVLASLRSVCDRHGLASLGEHLDGIGALVRSDLAEVELGIAALPAGDDDVHRSARHLLERGGKRLRPTCVSLASRLGTGFSPQVRDLGVAVELVHCATLLHDDVVDHGDLRRGVPTARALYGNAASIFAGDYLLVEALRLVRRAAPGDVLEQLLDRIDAMIGAEALQLAGRGRFEASEERYFRIVDGKTAALFQWALYAGARAGGMDPARSTEFGRFGREIGVAFQLVDDALDYEGTAEALGKEPFADLREGKTTYPLLVAMRADEATRALVARVAAEPAVLEQVEVREALARAIRSSGAVSVTRALAENHVDRAVAVLGDFELGPARRALEIVARAIVLRDS